MNHGQLTLFALNATREFGERVAKGLSTPLAPHEERDFADGEHVSRPLESVRDADVFVIQSLYEDREESVNDKLCRLLFFVSALKDASAERVTAVVPYLCYAREDRRTQPREPVTTRYVARLLEAAGVDRLIGIDVHDVAAFQNAFRIPVEQLTATPLFIRHFVSTVSTGELAVVSPDVGGIKRAERFREKFVKALGRPVEGAFLTKRRIDGQVSSETTRLLGSISGRTAIIFDDMIATGQTIRRAARACREAGATSVLAAATHGLFAGEAEAMVADDSLDQIIVTDSVPSFRLRPELAREKLTLLDATGLVSEGIRRLHCGESLTSLTEG